MDIPCPPYFSVRSLPSPGPTSVRTCPGHMVLEEPSWCPPPSRAPNNSRFQARDIRAIIILPCCLISNRTMAIYCSLCEVSTLHHHPAGGLPTIGKTVSANLPCRCGRITLHWGQCYSPCPTPCPSRARPRGSKTFGQSTRTTPLTNPPRTPAPLNP